MTEKLAVRLKRQIAQTGPISVAEYMAACLFDPHDGYYTTREPFGRTGDFITAPEISQMFGELIAVSLATAWQSVGMPDRIVIAEIGPGRGTLMADMLRSWQRIAPQFSASASFFMIDASTRLAEKQKATLQDLDCTISWIKTVDDLPHLPLFLVGNELFDAIPARQFVKTGGRWFERMIGLGRDDELVFTAGASELTPQTLPAAASHEPDGAIFEIAPAREALAGLVSDHIVNHGGAALFFDYGHFEPGFGDTLQAVQNHHYVDALANPGKADLTSHVDFSALAAIAADQGAKSAFLTQGEFLLQMGILERAGQLGAGANEPERRQIEQAVERLAGPEEMGNLFKSMAVFAPGIVIEPFGHC